MYQLDRIRQGWRVWVISVLAVLLYFAGRIARSIAGLLVKEASFDLVGAIVLTVAGFYLFYNRIYDRRERKMHLQIPMRYVSRVFFIFYTAVPVLALLELSGLDTVSLLYGEYVTISNIRFPLLPRIGVPVQM